MASEFEPLRGTKAILLYKRDGTPVSAPVSVVFEEDRTFFRSYDKAWKTKRPAHQLARRGRASDPSRQADRPPDSRSRDPRKRRAGPDRGQGAGTPASSPTGILVPIAHRVMRYKTMHYELHPGQQ